MLPAPRITVEFFGTARLRAGRSDLPIEAATVADALTATARECPALAGVVDNGKLSGHYLASVNAGPFLIDLHHPLAAGDRLLLLSADAGG